MAIDLGGIAKGYAADEIVRILKDSGVKHALINLGGNVYAHGKKPTAPCGALVFRILNQIGEAIWVC